MEMSYSRASLYEDCPSLFYDKYVLKIEEPATYISVFGRVFHLAVKLYATSNSSNMEDAIAQAIDKEAAPYKIFINKEKVKMLLSSPEIRDVINLKNEKSYEENFKINLGDSPTEPELRGYVDLRINLKNDDNSNKLIVIGDWKTGPTYDTRQLGLYAWALSKKYGYTVPFMGWFIFLNEDDPEKRSKHFEINPQFMQETRDWIYSIARDIESKFFELEILGGDPKDLFPEKTGSKQCKWCKKALHCTKRRQETGLDLVIPKNITNIEEAEDVAQNIIQISETQKILKELLKNWVKENGVVSIPELNKQFCLTPSMSWSRTSEQNKIIYEQLINEGKNPFELFTLGAAQIKKLGWSEDRLTGLGAKKTLKNNFSIVDAAAS